jgi:hypothetical protein
MSASAGEEVVSRKHRLRSESGLWLTRPNPKPTRLSGRLPLRSVRFDVSLANKSAIFLILLAIMNCVRLQRVKNREVKMNCAKDGHC